MVDNAERVKRFSEIARSIKIKKKKREKTSWAWRTTENHPVCVQSYLTQVIHGHSRANLDHWIDRLLAGSGLVLSHYAAFAFSKRIAAPDGTLRRGREDPTTI
ncbi:hypothetical protein K0M31_020054 [Melipona bicolor]|uniref:Uncharacterized protein n=1 Tax=Melipona bicolor TaxID=60889 RepID=A0AA40G0W1_9HYME|nr:hypothetical protein K0M31_020054 [Melipona bicolor]